MKKKSTISILVGFVVTVLLGSFLSQGGQEGGIGGLLQSLLGSIQQETKTDANSGEDLLASLLGTEETNKPKTTKKTTSTVKATTKPTASPKNTVKATTKPKPTVSPKTSAAPKTTSKAKITENLKQNTTPKLTSKATASPKVTLKATTKPTATKLTVNKSKAYTSRDEVALYIHTYGTLPKNFISKQEAQSLGWDSAVNYVGDVAKDKSIGGDRFGNFDRKLPTARGRQYYECDIDYKGKKRNAKRIVYSNDGLIYYTDDHYDSFTLLYTKEGKQ